MPLNLQLKSRNLLAEGVNLAIGTMMIMRIILSMIQMMMKIMMMQMMMMQMMMRLVAVNESGSWSLNLGIGQIVVEQETA